MRMFLLFTLAALLGCGCVATRQEEVEREQQQQVLRDREQRRLIEEYQQRTQMSLQDMESQIGQLQREVRAIREETSRAQARDMQTMEQRITRLEASIRELDQRRQKDREEIIDILSRRMAELMARQPASRGGGGSGGNTHEVQPGETLGSIAAQYGVTVRALIEANNISNPNALRVGQRLVIPR